VKRWLAMASLSAVGVVVLATATVCLTSGCSTLGYYLQSVGGHLDMVRAARPVPDWLADPGSPEALKQRLALSQRMRDWAVTELHLPDNASYRRYADLKRPAAVWNVVAAPELSLTLKTWCFPVVGCVGYRGYFDRAQADAYAGGLRHEQLEVAVYGVPAYSTLGRLPHWDWLADPLLNTFIHYPEGELARLIFHELAHQVAYAQDDTEFNESFATAVERIGGQRWLATMADQGARDDYARYDGRRQDFRRLTGAYRDKLEALYRSPLSEDVKRARKAELMAALRTEYAALKAERWGGFSGYDAWFERANNASFGVLAAYNALVPGFERLYEREGRDFGRFYAEVRRLATMSKAERRAALDASTAHGE
jgi:predicted aminopeptidase